MQNCCIIHFICVGPEAPSNITTIQTGPHDLTVNWMPPTDSLVTTYTVKYRDEKTNTLRTVPDIPSTETSTVISSLLAGDRFTVSVLSVSNNVSSQDSQSVQEILGMDIYLFHH